MQGINNVIIAGNVLASIEYGQVGGDREACSFQIASDRYGSAGIVTAFVKVNVYREDLVKACKAKLARGLYVIVEGELMNRHGPQGNVTEVRATQVVFLPKTNAGGVTHGTGSRQQQE